MNCLLCPRACGADREKTLGFCGMPAQMRIGRACRHIWEEPPISGSRGSGTVFFSGCSLKCVYCQNYSLSRGEGVPAVYLSLDGVNVRADVQSAADVVKELSGDAFALPELSVDTDALLAKLLSVDLASMISSSEEGVTLAAGRLLSALGVSLDVGDVTLSETASGVRVQALGASVSLAPAQSFTLDENDYADYTDVVPWLSALTQLLSSQALRAEVSYETEEVVVGGELLLDVASLAVTGEVSLSYAGAEKTVSFAYLPESGVYVAVDGIKGRVPRAALSDLLSELLPAGGGDAKDLLARRFALDLSQAGLVLYIEIIDKALRSRIILHFIIAALITDIQTVIPDKRSHRFCGTAFICKDIRQDFLITVTEPGSFKLHSKSYIVDTFLCLAIFHQLHFSF